MKLTIAAFLLVLSATAPAFAQPSDKEVGDAVATFKKSYAAKEDSARLTAIEAVASVQHKHVVDALAVPLAKDASSSVRRAAAKAIGNQWASNAPTVLMKAL